MTRLEELKKDWDTHFKKARKAYTAYLKELERDRMTKVTAKSNGCKEGITGKLVKSDLDGFCISTPSATQIKRHNSKPVQYTFVGPKVQ